MDVTKAKVLVRLNQGEEAKAISEDLDMSYSRVLRYRTEYNKAKETDTLRELMLQAPEVLQAVGEEMLLEIPEITAKTVEQVSGLTVLEQSFQKAALAIAQRITIEVVSVDNVSELESLSESLCKLQSTFFEKGAQINVQNNYGSTSGYGEFLSDAPGGAPTDIPKAIQ